MSYSGSHAPAWERGHRQHPQRFSEHTVQPLAAAIDAMLAYIVDTIYTQDKQPADPPGRIHN